MEGENMTDKTCGKSNSIKSPVLQWALYRRGKDKYKVPLQIKITLLIYTGQIHIVWNNKKFCGEWPWGKKVIK